MSSHAGQDRTRERIEIERDFVTQTARLAEAQAALAESRHAAAAYIAETAAHSATERRRRASSWRN